jgi:hypothetical protein
MKVKISCIENKVKELKRNKKHEKVHEISMEPFFYANVAVKIVTIPPKSATSSTFDVDTLALTNKKLAEELASTQNGYDLEVAKTDGAY